MTSGRATVSIGCGGLIIALTAYLAFLTLVVWVAVSVIKAVWS